MSRPYAKVLRRFENDGPKAVTDRTELALDEKEAPSGEAEVVVTPLEEKPESEQKSGVATRSRRTATESAEPPAGKPASPGSSSARAEVSLRTSEAPSLLKPRGPNQAQLSRSGLLDVLRTVVPRHGCPSVVIVGVSGAENLSNLVLGLARQADANGLGFLHVQVTSGPRGRSLNVLDNTSDSPEEPYEIGTIEHWNQETSGRPSREREFDRWLEEASLHHDLILVEGPPIDQSLEAALLASHCDGLVLAAEVDRTHRAALSLASERATASGCHVLGVVLTETRRWLPRWLDRLLDEMMP